MTKNEKVEAVAEVRELLEGANGVFAVDFSGLTVANAIRLRREFKKAGIRYKVAKNTLVKRALKDAGGYDTVLDRFVGQLGIAIGYDDPAAPARVLKEFIDPKVDIPKLSFAVIEGELFEGSRLSELAAMPSRKDMIASIMGALNAPASGIVGAINAVMRDLASVIEEVAKSKEAAA
jgi:large subunit ribosomal protein L10